MNDAVGKILFLQEGGGKARVVCAPNIWVQMMMRPLADHLDAYTRLLETVQLRRHNVPGFSVRFDQPLGAWVLKEWFAEERELYSFDYKAATDRFPIEPQLALLEGLGLEDWGRALEAVAKSPYHCQETDEIWTYSVGQPMGMCASMALFHLTHYALLEALSLVTNSQPRSFAVLGDDSVVADKTLAQTYENMVGEMGIDISRTKSFEGSAVQQFAGFLAMKIGKEDSLIFRPFKHGPGFSSSGRTLSLMHSVGWKLRKWDRLYEKYYKPFKESLLYRNPDLTLDKGAQILLDSSASRNRKLQSTLDDPGIAYVSSAINRLFGRPDLESWDLPSMTSINLEAVLAHPMRSVPEALVVEIAKLFPQRNLLHYGTVFSPEVYVQKTVVDSKAGKPWIPYEIDVRKDPLIRHIVSRKPEDKPIPSETSSLGMRVPENHSTKPADVTPVLNSAEPTVLDR